MHVSASWHRWPMITRRRAAQLLGILLALLCLTPLPVAADSRTNWEFTADNSILNIAASADNSLIAVAARDDNVYIFDGEGNLQWQWEGRNSMTGVDVSDDGSLIITSNLDRYLRLFSRDGELLWEFQGGRGFIDCAITSDGEHVVGISYEGRTMTMLARDGTELWTKSLIMPLYCVDIYGTGDNRRPVVGTGDSQIRVLNKDGDELMAVQLDAYVRDIAVSGNGARIAAALEYGSIVYVDGAAGKVIWRHETQRPGTGDRSRGIGMSADGQVIMAGVSYGDVFLYDAEGNVLQTADVSEDPIEAILVSPDGSLLAYGGQDSILRVSDRAHFEDVVLGAQRARRNLIIGIIAAIAAVVVLFTLIVVFTEWGRHAWHETLAPTRRTLAAAWRSRISYLMLLPTFALLLTFNYYPAASGLYHGFTRWTPGLRAEWIGIENYRAAFQNEYLGVGVKNAILFIVTGYLQLLSPLLVAELVFNLASPKAQYWWRTVFIFPMVVPGVVAILLWVNIYDPNYGMLNKVLELFNLEHLQRVWLGDEKIALWAIIFMGFPWVGALALLLFYGGLIAIPTELFDAAKVDGCNFVQRFWNIDLPLLLTPLKTLIILGFIGGVQAFGNVFLTTGGGPGHSTYTPALEMYYQATLFDRMGSASAIGTLLFAVILTGTILNLKYFRGSETEFQA
jgi:ABC-type sugar transport system permease subunit/outer membrane protein assembly factor BamB